ncbi:MAG: reverse transcriptase family protein, partial [Pseudomonadota bacterium]
DKPLVITDFEINLCLQSLKKGSGGVDGIPFWVFKNNSLFISSVIAHIFNNCFKCGIFPSVFKFADVIPIPKVSKPSSLSDLRPISMLPVLSKVLEKLVVCRWIMPHVSSKLSPAQFAYVPGVGKGTTTALTLINHLIMNFLDKKSGAVRMLAADFSKAFDRLSFDSIISALVNFCLPRQAVALLMNFLCDRKQRVRLNGNVSDWAPITSGVPQGSVLGPILFSLVIDSYSPVRDNSMCIKFADDLTILHFIRAETDDFLQCEWDHLESWSDSVGLRLNRNKSCVMNYITKKSLNLVSITCDDGVTLSTVSSLRLLGVIFSSDFSWNLHIQSILNKCYRRFFILRNLKRASCPPFIIHKCYVAFIRSILLYSFPCFCNLPQYLFNKLCRLEVRASKYFSEHDFCHLKEATDSICKKLFKSIVFSCNHPLRRMFDSRSPTARNPCVLRAPFAKTARLSNSFIRYGRF